jgi:hypothetical protein
VARTLTRLLIVVVLLFVVLIAADRAAAYLVSRTVAGGIQQSQRLSAPVSVSIPGIPFVTQAVRGSYDTVDVTLRAVPTGRLTVDRIDATLHGVHASAAEALRGQLTSLIVDRASAVAEVSFASLQDAAGRLLGGKVVAITLGRGSENRVAVTATVGTLVGKLTVSGQAQLSVSKGVVAVRLIPSSLSGVPAGLRSAVSTQVDLSGLAPELPYGFRATAVSVDDTGLQVQAVGTALTIPA